MIVYPSSLPFPQHSGFEYQHSDPVLSSELKNGLAVKRLNKTYVPSVASVSWIFTNAQAAAFEAWHKDVTVYGIHWFSIMLNSPMGMFPYDCRFIDTFSGPTSIGAGLWKYAANLELIKRPTLDNGWGLIPLFWKYRDIFDVAMNCRWPTVVQPTPTNCATYLPAQPPHGEDI